jgi:hypothetical protein
LHHQTVRLGEDVDEEEDVRTSQPGRTKTPIAVQLFLQAEQSFDWIE